MLLFDGLLLSFAAQRPLLAACLELHGEHGFVPQRTVRSFARLATPDQGPRLAVPPAARRVPAGELVERAEHGPAHEQPEPGGAPRLVAGQGTASLPARSSTGRRPPPSSESQTTARLPSSSSCASGTVSGIIRTLTGSSPTSACRARPSVRRGPIHHAPERDRRQRSPARRDHGRVGGDAESGTARQPPPTRCWPTCDGPKPRVGSQVFAARRHRAVTRRVRAWSPETRSGSDRCRFCGTLG